MELVNIVYRYMNRFINSDELVNLLINVDRSNFSNDEKEELDKIILEVKEVINSVNNEIDDVEEERIKSYNMVIDAISNLLNDDSYNDDMKEQLSKNYESLIGKKEKVRDCGPRYERLVNLLMDNSLYKKYYNNMSDEELLDYITQFISVPNVPDINQESFDRLVSIAINNDNNEKLWRLAFNYNKKGIDFTRIEDYFISKRDDYYLTELICAVEDDLDMNRLVDKVFNTNDKEFIFKCGNRANELDLFNDEEKDKIRIRLNEL